MNIYCKQLIRKKFVFNVFVKNLEDQIIAKDVEYVFLNLITIAHGLEIVLENIISLDL
jgi:hypothetical protein